MSRLLAVASFLYAVQGAAQEVPARGTLAGRVRDEATARPIARVVLSVPELGRTAVTDSAGWYELRDLGSGERRLTLTRPGFAPRSIMALVPASGTLAIDFTLQRVPVQLARVEVRAGMRRVDGSEGSEPDYPDRELSSGAIANNPLLVQPDVLLSLSGGEVVTRPEAPAGVHIRGGASDQTAYVLDGIPILNPYHSGGVFGGWNPDAIAAVQLAGAAPKSGASAVLSGVVSARTRAPGSRVESRGALSSTHASLVVDGPIGGAGVGFLVSARNGYPGVIAPRGESSYLRGESGDLLATLTIPALGGRLRLLGFDASNELGSGAVVLSETSPAAAAPKNAFAWNSRSTGAEWRRTGERATVRAAVWRATAGATATWNASDATRVMRSDRRDAGAMLSAEHVAGPTTTSLGARVERSRTAYEARVVDAVGLVPEAAAATLASVFAEHARRVGGRVELSAGSALTVFRGTARFDPRAAVRWDATGRLTVSASYTRAHQYVQSLRDPESIVGTIFPADLFAVAGSAGVPVGRSDLGLLAAEYRPSDDVRVGVQGFARSFAGLALVAPTGGDPFATGSALEGSGSGRGVSVDLAITGRRAALTAAYALQHVRYRTARTDYTPEHAPQSVLEGGVIAFPTPGWTIRLGSVAAFGRRGTPVVGDVEWEACNLLDQGCELAGTPRHERETLGRSSLGPYLRLDLGVRRAWNVTMRNRTGEVGAFGALTNVLGRRNVLAYASTAAPLGLTPIEMRPRAPLVVGMDWRF